MCDFTAGRYDIGKAASNIVFNGQSSMIYDAIYNTVPSSVASSDVPTLYRTVVITDGVYLTNIGVTMEDLFLKLQSERYPVDVLAVTATAAETANKELSAITRISSGRYCALAPSTDLSTLTFAKQSRWEPPVPFAICAICSTISSSSTGISSLMWIFSVCSNGTKSGKPQSHCLPIPTAIPMTARCCNATGQAGWSAWDAGRRIIRAIV